MRLTALIIGALLWTACVPLATDDGGGVSSSSSFSSFSSNSSFSSSPSVSVVAEGLDIPWSIAWLPSGEMLVTERPGTLRRIMPDGQRSYPIQGVMHRGEGGLLGLALHPDFPSNRWLYLYLTTAAGGGLANRVERYLFAEDGLTERTVILEGIPGAANHDGGFLGFGPDGYLYVTTGDAGNPDSAQDTASLAGKILRIADDGSIPPDNPFGNAVYSYGHRNPQGLAWDERGRLWSTEHGRSGIRSGYDELNRIERGGNYGWPVLQGDEEGEGMIAPVLHSGPDTTWAPASAAFLNGSIVFGGLRGRALFESMLPEEEGMPVLRRHLDGAYGRIRFAGVGPDGMLYLTTSNTDGRGDPVAGDDRILRVDPAMLE